MRLRIRDSGEKIVLDVRVGESGERSVRAEKALQQAERRIQSHRKSLGSQGGEENLQKMMMKSPTLKALEVTVERR